MYLEDMENVTAIVYREPKPTERKARVFYRCRNCRSRKVFSTLQITQKRHAGYGRYTYDIRFLVQRGDSIFFDCLPFIACDCGGLMGGNILKGLKSDTPCDARCTDATGNNCECQCAGENHGTGATILRMVGASA